ncbi:hypothetical protein [Mesorhizobium sp. M0579]|uniref:hypothetical protein n=1 Tax=Mesorhizobium sp. M0579 TaxID=2956962 RepID=UPI0033382647
MGKGAFPISAIGSAESALSRDTIRPKRTTVNDAEVICEAVGRPSIRYVPPKSTDQLAIQAVHRIRQRRVADGVRLVNQFCGPLSEHGIVIARDISKLRRNLAVIVGNDDAQRRSAAVMPTFITNGA